MTTARPAKPRNEGQWALGDREPLNPNEEFKAAVAKTDVKKGVLLYLKREGGLTFVVMKDNK